MRALVALVLVGGVAAAQPAGSGSAKIIQLPTDASAPEVRASASPTDIKLGARFTLFITASYGPGVEVNLPAVYQLGGAFEVKRTSSEDRTAADGRHVREWQLDVYAWELGDLAVPPITVTYTAGGRAEQIQTNAVPVRVTGVLGDADDPKLMRDNAPPVPLQSRDWFWVWIGAAAGALVGAAIAAIVLRRRRRRRVVRLVGTLVPSRSRRIDMTSERALERLLAIEQSGVLDDDRSRKPGYAEMVDVIRDYLGARYRTATSDLTTAELIRALSPVAPAGERGLVEAWLARCDVVKYGGFRATADDARDVLAGARSLVIATTAEPAREAA